MSKHGLIFNSSRNHGRQNAPHWLPRQNLRKETERGRKRQDENQNQRLAGASTEGHQGPFEEDPDAWE